jgi:hypothetical protein
MPIGINLGTAIRRRIVMLSATKHLGAVNEILRFAQDDTSRDSFIRLMLIG